MQYIEVVYVTIFAIITLFTILTYTRKMSTGIALMSLVTGVAIAWLFIDYMNMLIQPLNNVIFYGYPWSLFTLMVLTQIILFCIAIAIRGYNLFTSGGKIGWA